MGENSNLIRVGITGQSGFIGTHLYNSLGLMKDAIKLVPFEKKFFDEDNKLAKWVKQCDVIVHLAAISRHEDGNILFNSNVKLVKKLISTVKKTKTTPHIIFSSSVGEECYNIYGQSKKKGRELFKSWAKKSGSIFTGLLIPNVFGPFGKPFYNSVIATFCYQLTHDETPRINVDAQINLIYIQELIEEITKIILKKINNNEYKVKHTSGKKVSEILHLLNLYKKSYFEEYIIPKLNNKFEINLFNTYHCYFDHKSRYPVLLNDRSKNKNGNFSFTTKQKIPKDDHFHTHTIERHFFIKGKAIIRLRRIGTKQIIEFKISENNPAFIDIPIWHTYNITNIGQKDLSILSLISKSYNPDDDDTYFETV